MATNDNGTLKIQSRNGTVTLTATHLSFRPKFGTSDSKRWEIARNLIASVEIIHRSSLGWNLSVHGLDGSSLRLDWVPANDAERLYELLTSASGLGTTDNENMPLPANAPPSLTFAPLLAHSANDGWDGWDDPQDPRDETTGEAWRPAFSESAQPATVNETNAIGSQAPLENSPIWQVLPPVETPADAALPLASNAPTNERHDEAHPWQLTTRMPAARQQLARTGSSLAAFSTQMAIRGRQTATEVRERVSHFIAQRGSRQPTGSATPTETSNTTMFADSTRATAPTALVQRGTAARSWHTPSSSSFWQRLRSAPGNVQAGIGCGALLLVSMVCCVSLLYFSGNVGGTGSPSPSTAHAALNATHAANATATWTAILAPTATGTATATSQPTATSTPQPTATAQPTSTPVPQLTLTFTCAYAINHVKGQVCVHTQPEAALTIKVYYACSKLSQPGLPIVSANANGNALWAWFPANRCNSGTIAATVTARWQGQTLTQRDIFRWG